MDTEMGEKQMRWKIFLLPAIYFFTFNVVQSATANQSCKGTFNDSQKNAVATALSDFQTIFRGKRQGDYRHHPEYTVYQTRLLHVAEMSKKNNLSLEDVKSIVNYISAFEMDSSIELSFAHHAFRVLSQSTNLPEGAIEVITKGMREVDQKNQQIRDQKDVEERNRRNRSRHTVTF